MPDKREVVNTIKKYITRCGGSVPIDYLLEDYRFAYKSHLPFLQFGFTSVEEFIATISGIFIQEYEDGIYVENTQYNADASHRSSTHFDDLTNLSIRMKNNLVLDCRNNERVVTIHPESAPVVPTDFKNSINCNSLSNDSDETAIEKSLSRESVASTNFLGDIDNSSVSAQDISYWSDYDSSLQENFYVHNECEPPSAESDLSEQEDFFLNTKSCSTLNKHDFITSQEILFLNMKLQRSFLIDESGDWIPEKEDGILRTSNELKLSTVTDSEIISRITKLINSNSCATGMDSKTIELKYNEMYSSALPKQWLNLIEESSLMYMENLRSSVIIYPNRWFPIPPTLTSLPALRYPNTKEWNAYVTSYEGTACVWFRLLDDEYDVKNDILRHEMGRHYQRTFRNMKNLTKLKAGELCSVHYKNEWYRGLVIDLNNNDYSIICLLIDEGTTVRLKKSNVFELHEKFTNTPALALQATLAGLEEWDSCNYINCKVRQLLLKEREIKVEVVEFVSEKLVSLRINVMTNLQNIDVNQKMLEIAKSELLLPTMHVNDIYDVIVVSPVQDNFTYIQLLGPSLRLLEKSLNKVSELMEGNDYTESRVKAMFDLKLGKIYLAKYENEKWRRIMCCQFHLHDRVSALFIDYAEVRIVPLDDILDTVAFPDTINFIEAQAIPVKMSNIDATMLGCLGNIKKPGIFSIKVLNDVENLVQFFTKLPDVGVAPIHNMLNMIDLGQQFGFAGSNVYR